MNTDENNDHLDAYGQLATNASREDLAAALAASGVEVAPAACVVRLRIEDERIELEPMTGGYLLSRNNDGPAWIAGLQRLSVVLTSLGIKHRFEFMQGDRLTKRLHHDWPTAERNGDER